MKNFNGYGLFYDVRNTTIRTFNRINVFLNVKERHGHHVAHNYLKKFRRHDQISIFNMMKEINRVGYEQFKRNVMRERNA